ncbi:MAG TPA: TIR domain-containing protein [Terrimicrobiaceae bacterium]
MPKAPTKQFDYDVCLSFAGEDRNYVAKVAAALKSRGIRVFYDRYEEVRFWGKDLYEHLHEVYSQLARYCVVFISKHYGKKLWTDHERKSAQERAFKQHAEYLLPVRFDDTRLPGMRSTVGYLSVQSMAPKALADRIAAKLGARQRRNYFPPEPDRLLAKLPLDGETDCSLVTSRARRFFDAMLRTDQSERRAVFAILLHGCPTELPENIHINLDLLRRMTGMAPVALKRTIGRLDSLGFSSRVRRDRSHGPRLAEQEFLELRFDSLSVDSGGPATEIAVTMIQLVAEGFCADCAAEALMKLDFGQLSSATHELERHRRSKNDKRTI